MKYRLFPLACLRIYETGLSHLMDENWLFSHLPIYLDIRIGQKKTPNDLFFKTIQSGILNILGELFFDEIFTTEDDVLFCDAQTAFTRSAESYYFLVQSGCSNSEALIDLWLAVDAVDNILVETPPKRVNSVFHRQKFHIDLYEALTAANKYYQNDIDKLRILYSKNFAERIFHDRQLCEYISFALTTIYKRQGFPAMDNEQMTIKLVERKKWPSWVRKTLEAREREKCANCNKSFTELETIAEIDHIVPLARGGCNDIVNLQLLCYECNHEKLDKKLLVNSSFPEYMRIWSKKGHKYKKTS